MSTPHRFRAPAVTFLIDGYNLMHALGLAPSRSAAAGLERARTRLLDWLAHGAADREERLRVVFDAQQAPCPSQEYGYKGVRVRFAFGRTADELIEELAWAEARPKRLAVVSNDNQVREAGRRRGCVVKTCAEFVDWVLADRPGAGPPAPDADDKPVEPPTPEELAAWADAFSAPRR